MKSLAEELQIRERWMLGPVSEQTLRLGVKENSDVGFGFRHGQIRISPTSSTLFSNEEGPLPNMWCAFCNGPQPSIRCAVVTDPETWKNIVRQKGRCFGCLKTSHIIFFMWKCNDEQRLTMSMRTQNSRLRRMEKKLSVWESGCTADWPIPFSRARICSHI